MTWRSFTDPAVANQELQPRRILIVDDDVSLSRVLMAILMSSGFAATVAHGGFEALELVERERFDAIILDLRMASLDGRSFFRELRGRGFTQPVLIASAYGARAAQIDLGAQGAIEKPFDPERLVQMLRNMLPPDETPGL
jgi:DNA-binding response OmpR family regulator